MLRFAALAVALLACVSTAGTASGAGEVLRASPPQVHFGTREVGTQYFKSVTITNTGSSAVLLIVTGERLPDDFGFGLWPGSTCPALGAEPIEPGASCDAVMSFFPSEFFAGQTQLAQLRATATDPASGAVVDSIVVDFLARGRVGPE